jgi:hypothetical protein
MNISPALAAQVKAATAGLSHDEKETFALRLAEVAAGEPVGFLKCDRGGLLGWIEKGVIPAPARFNGPPVDGRGRVIGNLPPVKDEKPAIRFTAEEEKLILSCGMKPERVARFMREKPASPGREDVTDEELARLGLTRRQYLAGRDARDVSEYRRRLTEVA